MPLLEVDNRAEKLISGILALVYEASALVMGPLSRPQVLPPDQSSIDQGALLLELGSDALCADEGG